MDDPILKRFKAALVEIYGDRIDRVMLFGSRARDEAHEDSDYDVAVFLKSLPERWKELDRLANLRVDFLDDTGAFFDAKPYLAGFHAAQAFISEKTGKSVKTHKGVQSEMYRLTKDDPDFAPDLRVFYPTHRSDAESETE
jgi:predicted nucleotidyltransferase